MNTNLGDIAVSETLSLSDVPRIIRNMTGKRASYQRLYRLLVDGDLPGEKNSAGRWRVRREDIPVIANHLGLMTTQEGAE
jgi:hypothetical protein